MVLTSTSTAVLAGLGAAAASVVLTPVVGRIATAMGLVDVPHARKVHRVAVPRVGGTAIGVAVLGAVTVAVVAANRQGLDVPHGWGRVVALLVGAASLLVVGLIDDAADLRSTYKLLALVTAATVFCAAGGSVRYVMVHDRQLIDLGLAGGPLTVLWIVTVTVSINFIDGLDGLAGGIVATAAAVLAVGSLAGGYGYWPSAVIGLALAGGLGGFLVYNRHPARIFMGDSGSMFIGFLLAAGCALANKQVGTTRSVLLPGMTLAIPLLDTGLTMVRRGVLQRRSLFAAERGHVHHRLMDSGLGHRHTVHVLHAVTLGGAAVSMVCIYAGGVAAVTAAVAFGCGLVVLFRSAGSVRARDTVAAVRRNRAIGRENRRYQSAFYDLQLRFREAHTLADWWQVLCRAADVLDFAKVDVPLTRRDGSPTVLRWRRAGDDALDVADTNSITAEVPIPQRRSGAAVRAVVEVVVTDFLESGGQRVALFARLMSEFGLDQLRGGAPAAPTDVKRALAAGPIVQVDLSATAGPFPKLRVAVVHDFLYTYAGAERVLEQLLAVFPQADLFALFDFLPEGERGFIRNKPVTTSFLQRLPLARTRHRLYLPLMPLAVEQLDVAAYDLVISSSYVAAKGVITRPDQLHVCYCHTPVRFAWDLQNQYLGQTGLSTGLRAWAAKVILHYIRNWDVHSAHGVDVFLSNSNFVRRRIRKIYRREATTLYPPVDTEAFALHEAKEDYYLTASRMVPYKRIDLIVEAFTRAPHRKLLVVGMGPDYDRLKAAAGPNVTFLGHEPADRLLRHMQMARAFVFAAEEDFGIAPVEAQACGTPVIAFGRGGVTETVVEGRTGVFFAEQSVAAILAAVDRFETLTWDARAIRAHAERFSAGRFRHDLAELVHREWAAFTSEQVLNGRFLGAVLPTAGVPRVAPRRRAGDLPGHAAVRSPADSAVASEASEPV